MSRKFCILFIALVLLVGCSSKKFEPALAFEIPDTEIPLAEPGPYSVGYIFDLENHDETRDDRKVTYAIYYPSLDDEPDSRGAPFPLIISSGNMLSKFGEHIASHGFIMIGLFRPDEDTEGDEVIHHPLDLMFVLDQLSEDPPDILDGLIDTDHVGVWGYSGFSRAALILSGAQIDPDYYFEICENPEIFAERYGVFRSFVCEPYEEWDQLIEETGSLLPETKDGFLQSVADERIIAIIPMSVESEYLFGPKGMASADRAVLFSAGTNEDILYDDMFRMFQEYGGAEKTFISFVGQNHMMVFGSYAPKIMQHLAVAFFSYHLKGDEAYAEYYSEEFISQVEGLAWGWYEE